MPWKETNAVDERIRFIEDYWTRRWSVAELAERYGVSRKTAYKWIERQRQGGFAALADKSRAPRRRPNRVSSEVANRIVELRQRHPSWGPKKLKSWLENNQPKQVWPAASTIGALLKSRGLVAERHKKRRTPLSTQPLAAATESNMVWSADFKGQFKVGGRYCYPLTITDNFSRYILAVEGVNGTQEKTAKPIFERAFHENGLPWRIRTDNGAPFASKAVGGLSRLSIWWVKLGITPERIEPGQPQQNGRHERMHRTLKAETARPPKSNEELQQEAFDSFRKVFNDERPHEALNQQPPASVYLPSSREMPNEVSDPDYPYDFITRRVRSNGHLRWEGGESYLSTLLSKEAVGIEEIGDGLAQLWFGPIYLGLLRKEVGNKITFIENKG